MKEKIIAQLKKRQTFIRFIIVGATGIVVNLFFLWLFKSFFSFSLELAGIIAIELSVVNNFLLNDRWAFGKRARKIPVISRFARYNISVALGILINFLILIILTNIGVFYLVSNMIGIFFSTISNYLFSSRWAWRKDD